MLTMYYIRCPICDDVHGVRLHKAAIRQYLNGGELSTRAQIEIETTFHRTPGGLRRMLENMRSASQATRRNTRPRGVANP